VWFFQFQRSDALCEHNQQWSEEHQTNVPRFVLKLATVTAACLFTLHFHNNLTTTTMPQTIFTQSAKRSNVDTTGALLILTQEWIGK